MSNIICKLFGHKWKFVSYYGESANKQNFKCERCKKKQQRIV